MTYFEYGQKEINHLKRKEPVLGKEIDRLGKIKRKTKPDVFAALISSIISQQVSTRSAQTVEDRLKKLVGEITPINLHQLTREEIQQCGMSMRKADYIKGITEKAVFNEIDFDHLHQLSNQEIKKEFISLKGVGEWTAEMLLIHAFERKDIISYKDLGIRRGMMKLYGLEELTLETFHYFKEKYSPYASVASIYLWAISAE